MLGSDDDQDSRQTFGFAAERFLRNESIESPIGVSAGAGSYRDLFGFSANSAARFASFATKAETTPMASSDASCQSASQWEHLGDVHGKIRRDLRPFSSPGGAQPSPAD